MRTTSPIAGVVGEREGGDSAPTRAAVATTLSEAGGSVGRSGGRSGGPGAPAWAAPGRGCLGAGSGMLAQRSLACVLRLWNVLPHTAPRPSAAEWRDTPAVETLPSTLLIGHFYCSGYLGSFLARCHQLAVWGRGRAAGLSGPCEIPRQTGSSRGRVRTSSQDPRAPPDLPWPAIVMGGRPSGEGEENETGINLGKVHCKAGMLVQGGPW